MIKNNWTFCAALIFIFPLTGCGGSSSGSNNQPPVVSNSSAPTSPPTPLARECVLQPAISIAADAPQITLNGDRVIDIPLGATYIDAGAIAKDQSGNDLTSLISTTGLDKINTNLQADYFIRYDVKDAAGRIAASKHRIVRVFTNTPKKYSLRPFDSTSAPMGFLEHLPVFIGTKPQEKYPLLIVAHGWEHFVEQSPSNNRLSTLLYGANIYRVFDENLWPDSRPFIVLEPQRCVDIGDNEWHQVDQLIEWALAAYPVDRQRIYMTGMSAGGYFTYRYPLLYPHRLAAIVPMSAGGPVENPTAITQFCKAMKQIPIWAFHGSGDNTVPVEHTLYTIDILKQQCLTSPTPKVTIVTGGDHVIANKIWDDSYIGRGDAKYDRQNESIYDWFLRFTLDQTNE